MEFKDCLIVVSVGWYTSFISTILLLISVFKNRHRKLLLPWLAFGLIQIIMKLCQVTLVVISPQVSLEEITTAVGLLLITSIHFILLQNRVIIVTFVFLPHLYNIALEIYLWTVVYNYFNKLKRRDAVIINILTKLHKNIEA